MRHRVGRRKQPRIDFGGRIELFADGQHYEPARGDLSEGGLGLAQLNLPLFTPLKVFISLPQEAGETSTVMLDGEVAWRRLSRSGVRFTDAPPPVLRRFVRQAQQLRF